MSTTSLLPLPGRRVRPLVEKPAVGWKKRRAVREFIVDSTMLANLVSVSGTEVKASMSASASGPRKHLDSTACAGGVGLGRLGGWGLSGGAHCTRTARPTSTAGRGR